MFCPKAGPSLHAEKSRLQFCRRQVFHRKLRNQVCSFTRDLMGAVTFRCFPHPTLSLAWRMSRAFSHLTYVTAHSDSPSFPSLHLRHSSFSKPSLALPTSQLILQPFRCFTYVTAHSPTLLLPLLRHRIFTHFTWRAAHD